MKFDRRDIALYFAGMLSRDVENEVVLASQQDPQIQNWLKELRPVSEDIAGPDVQFHADRVYDQITKARQSRSALLRDPVVMICQDAEAFKQVWDGNLDVDKQTLDMVDVESHDQFDCFLELSKQMESVEGSIELPVLVDTQHVELFWFVNPSLDFTACRRDVEIAFDTKGEAREELVQEQALEPMSIDLVGSFDGSKPDQTSKSSFHVSFNADSKTLSISTVSEKHESVWVLVSVSDHVAPVRLMRSADGRRLVNSVSLPRQTAALPSTLSVTVRPLWLSGLTHLSTEQVREWVRTVGSINAKGTLVGEQFQFSLYRSQLDQFMEIGNRLAGFAILPTS